MPSTARIARIISIPLALLAFSCLLLQAASIPQDFLTCIANPGDQRTTCTLQPHPPNDPYSIGPGQTLQIGRSGIIVEGGGPTRASTTLRRSQAANYPLMRIPTGVTGVTVRNLYFDGNRGGLAAYRCLTGASGLTELDVVGSYNTVSADFDNSPWFSLQAATGTFITNSTFTRARIGGVYGFGGSNVLYVNNRFEHNGVNAIFVGNGALVRSNYFFNNHSEFSSGNIGGQIFISGTSNITVASNTFDGAFAQKWSGQSAGAFGCVVPGNGLLSTGGIEAAYGTNWFFWNNYIVNHYQAGIGVDSAMATGTVEVSGYDPGAFFQFRSPIVSGGFHGVWFHGNTQGLINFNWVKIIDNGFASGGYGIAVEANTPGTTVRFTNGACLSGNSSGRFFSSGNVFVDPNYALPATDTCSP
jgi:hypothetical protein